MKLPAALAAASAALLALTGPSAAAAEQRECAIRFFADDDLVRVLESGFDFPSYDDFCPWLAERDLGIDLVNITGTVGGHAYGSVVARIVRRANKIASPTYVINATATNKQGDEDADVVAYDGVMDAVESIATNRAMHLEALEGEEKRLADYFAASRRR